MVKQKRIFLPEKSRGIYLITDLIEKELQGLFPENGILHLFIQHTSAGICINENADADVRLDLENALDRLVPENYPYVHDMEGPDDMPAHIKSIMCGHEVNIPVANGRLALGQWQGIYLCEFRDAPHSRKIMATFLS